MKPNINPHPGTKQKYVNLHKNYCEEIKNIKPNINSYPGTILEYH